MIKDVADLRYEEQEMIGIRYNERGYPKRAGKQKDYRSVNAVVLNERSQSWLLNGYFKAGLSNGKWGGVVFVVGNAPMKFVLSI